MSIETIKNIFSNLGCQKIYVKVLAANDNSKNQVYLGGSFEILNILPISKIESVEAGDWSRERFKASINFSWVYEDGSISFAPKSQLILYPKYPEVRFSGFLMGCIKPPSDLMTKRLEGRLLFLGVSNKGQIYGHVVANNSQGAREFENYRLDGSVGVFGIIELSIGKNNKEKLIADLHSIYQKGWIKSKRLDANKNILPCEAPNCGGYTLEAELGISPNGFSEPDYLGWEIKQFGVHQFDKINNSIITLMTPEPNRGLYSEKGAKSFIERYGYLDLLGRDDRMNFGGVHKYDRIHPRTKLKFALIGFDVESGKIRNTDGQIALIDIYGEIAAGWSFTSLLLHWNRKHNQACYVPSMTLNNDGRHYKYGNSIMVCEGADFQLFLSQISNGNIYYDPGIKMENISTKPIIKKRSQFRIKSKFISELYKNYQIIRFAN